MAITYESALLTIAAQYEAAAADGAGKSLARVATIVVNRGSFFDRLRSGAGCSARNLERMAEWFRDPTNWPGGTVPVDAAAALLGIGRPVLAAEVAA